MRINNFQKHSYSSDTAKKYINSGKDLMLASAHIEETFDYDENHNRNITGQRIWLIQEGLNPFYIKLPTGVKIDVKQFDKISLNNLEAIEIKNNVYFRAESIIKQEK